MQDIAELERQLDEMGDQINQLIDEGLQEEAAKLQLEAEKLRDLIVALIAERN